MTQAAASQTRAGILYSLGAFMTVCQIGRDNAVEGIKSPAAAGALNVVPRFGDFYFVVSATGTEMSRMESLAWMGKSPRSRSFKRASATLKGRLSLADSFVLGCLLLYLQAIE